jgi:transcriptional regulator with XRE-family HTH domain
VKIGEFLRLKRLDKGLSIRSLAEKAEVSFAYVFRLEHGKHSPTLETLARLLKALDVGWIEFLSATGYLTPSKKPVKRKPRPRG